MSMKREAISKSERFEIFKRDKFTCQYCGATPPGAVLHVDHIVPVAHGGGKSEDNLITACQACNQGKAARSLTSVPKSLSDKAAEVAEREAQIAGYAAIMDAARERLDNDIWRVAEELHPGASEGYSRDKLNGIKRFITALGVHEVLEAADLATSKYGVASNRSFKYFCGVCWRKVREVEPE